MQSQIDQLDRRISTLEGERVALVDQSQRIEANTKELLETFNALKGAWKVLNAIGKLAAPLTFIGALYATYFTFKSGK
jgi:septal ring factor EnvC (AmiA/AmiB activator)